MRFYIARKPQRQKLLRTYRRVADKEHGTCWKCNWEIHSGEEYDGEVWAIDKKINVVKQHVVCPFDPEEEERRIFKEDEEKRERDESRSEAA